MKFLKRFTLVGWALKGRWALGLEFNLTSKDVAVTVLFLRWAVGLTYDRFIP